MSTETMQVFEPATEHVLAELPRAGVEEADEAVARAKAAFPAWRDVSPGERAKLLRRLARVIEEKVEELAQLEARNVGKPISDARGEVGSVVDVFDYYAGAPERLLGSQIPVSGGVDVTFREPLGVVGLITPWNFPLPIASWKIGPALAAGNTIVLKPAELTPLTALELGKLALEAGIPEGVLNVVNGPGRTVGERIVEHPDVAKVAFTGSTEVGRRVAEIASQTIKRVTLELGGKSANVVFADADLEKAAASAPLAVFGNAGQDCCARSRILVERSAVEPFLEALEREVKALRVGDPLDDATQMGPLISADHREKVASYVDDGAPVAFRGSAPDGPGYWFPPTVLSPVSNDDRVAREEIFGPVAAVIPFDDEADAVKIANDTVYGLSGSIWTRDGARALRVARALETGNISVNSNSSVRVTTPFGGFKQSGVGRELGPFALEHYTELKNVFIATS
ncbi:MAG TPA: aldehyde dehydrogenase family protein [Gaiellaceae bacterium]|nr:aldehyde dehydrogenase family protein [Gaiellaceae bacterium]